MDEYFKKEIVISKDTKLVFVTGLPVNLFFHVLNIYGVLRRHGETYKERKNDNTDPKLEKTLYTLGFDLAVAKLVACDPKTPEILFETFNSNEVENILTLALKQSWRQFYKNYWEQNWERLLAVFISNIETQDWVGIAKRMEILSDSKFESNFFLVGAEALAESAICVEPNISIGSVRSNYDVGFFHEGMHLLLNEKWANEPRIKSLVLENWNEIGGWGKNWKGKIEQVVVVSLDSMNRDMKQERRHDYFVGNNVGDLEEPFFEPLKTWYLEKIKGRSDKAIADVIFSILSKMGRF